MTAPEKKGSFWVKFIFYSTVLGMMIYIGLDEVQKLTAQCVKKQKVVKILEVTPEFILVQFDTEGVLEYKAPSVKLNEEICTQYKH